MSRRYGTRERQLAARAKWDTKQAQKWANAKVRQAGAKEISPRDQLAHLDRKFGPGQGAVKERAKLAAKIALLPPEPEKKFAKELAALVQAEVEHGKSDPAEGRIRRTAKERRAQEKEQRGRRKP